MSRARRESAFHIVLLILIQWTSLAVVILNATALYLLKHSQQSLGILNQHGGLIDYILLILGSSSFIITTCFLFFHLHLYFRIMDHQSFSPPRTLSAIEVVLSVISIALWTVVVSLILTYSQEPSAHCKFNNPVHYSDHHDVCELFHTTLMLAFAAVGSWVLALLATLFFLIRSPIPPTTIFTIEAPHRSPNVMTVSSPSLASQPSRSYYLGHHNKINPIHPNPEETKFNANAHSLLLTSEEEEEDNEELGSAIISSTTYYQPTRSSYHLTESILYQSQVNSQRSLSTMESMLAGIQTIDLDDLPIIKVGTLSHIDVSFLIHQGGGEAIAK